MKRIVATKIPQYRGRFPADLDTYLATEFNCEELFLDEAQPVLAMIAACDSLEDAIDTVFFEDKPAFEIIQLMNGYIVKLFNRVPLANLFGEDNDVIVIEQGHFVGYLENSFIGTRSIMPDAA